VVGADGRFATTGGQGLRSRIARGGLVHAAFLASLNVLVLVRGVALAGFLTTTEYGLWALLLIGFSTVGALAQVGIDDKYIQQDHPDQEAAFQVAFTLQCMLMALFAGLILVAMPLFALLYGHEELLAPGLTLALAAPAYALQAPVWVHYRRMNFVRQRLIQVADPVVALVLTIGLAIAGFGVWAPVAGLVVGAWSTAVLALIYSPYAVRLRYERGSLGAYASYSWPLFASALSFIVLAHTPALVADRTLGLAAVGAIALGTSIAVFAHRLDTMITDALYPAICAVKDRTDLLFEAFSKSNRLALLWALPCGTGVALFAADFVELVIGEQWRLAVGLIAIFGLTAALAEVAFNWTAFMRALGRTRPIAVAGVVQLVAVLAIAIPLLVSHGLTAFAAGNAVAIALAVGVRLLYLSRIFPLGRMLTELWRPVLPAGVAAGAILALRLAGPDGRGPLRVIAEVALFALLSAALSFAAERRLLREVVGYLRGSSRAPGQGSPLPLGTA
jgi:O-antigen/teichoic acid export membrane protein